MQTEIFINLCETAGRIKEMHCVNNGPVGRANYEQRSNFAGFAALNIPYVRNHDASLSEAYGSQHVADVHCIFPDFSRDPADASAYDFAITDYYNETVYRAGSRVFYRLGSSIEHWVQKYGTLVPADYGKWVDICEHIIMHYTEGWANGFHYDMPYWEIWNEPDLDPDDATNKRTWGGTRAQFFDLYELAAKRLKARFPHLKIGGPALAGNEVWAEAFLSEMQERGVPMDFFSWHIYTTDPRKMSETSKRMCALAEKYGYGSAEIILNEWNYVDDWSRPLDYLQVIKGLKGASFVTAVFCEMQTNSDVDMLMYYDARVEKIWNGLFSSDTLLPLKGYYSFKAFDALYQMGTAVPLTHADGEVFALAAKSADGAAVLLTNYAKETPKEKEVTLVFAGAPASGTCKIYKTDEETDLALTAELPLAAGKITFTLPAYNTCLVTVEGAVG